MGTVEFARRLVVAAAAAVLCLCGLTASALGQSILSDPFVSAIRSMKRSVTPVICVRPAGAGQFQPIIDGSGFFISRKGDFLTAAHVVDDFHGGRQLANCPMAIWFRTVDSASGNFQADAFFISLADCIEDESLDIARCHTIDDLSTVKGGRYEPEAVAIDAEKRDDGTAIAITGFPLFNPNPVSSRGYIGAYQDTGPRGIVGMVIDRSAWPGGSGSPVYDSRGRVIGMLVQAGEGTASGISIARTGNALNLFMTAHPLDR